MYTYFVYATYTSKESSLNADIDAMIGNWLQVVIRPVSILPRHPKNVLIFSWVVNVIQIFYFIKSSEFRKLKKIAFVVE